MAVFELDPAFREAFLRSAEARDLLELPAEETAARARELAPHAEQHPRFHIRDSIEAEVALTAVGFVGRVSAGSFIAHFFEFGTVKMEPRPFLLPALEEVVGPSEPAPEVDQ
jgi:HK97 gp10 family phage protein